MLVSIDFDGTMWSHMAFFRALMIGLQTQGHQVGCLTGHAAETEAADVRLMMSRGFPAPNFYFGRTPEFIPLNGAHFKLTMIEKHRIAMHFDDFDYNNPETRRIFDASPLRGRIIKVEHREPTSTHFEMW